MANKQINVDAYIKSVRLAETSDVPTVSTGYGQLYASTDGILNYRNGAATIYPMGSALNNIAWDAAGDLLIGASNNNAGRLQVGDDGKILTASSSDTLGVKWEYPERIFTFTHEGDVTVGAGTIRLYNVLGRTMTITKVFAAVDTAPTGATLIVDIHKNGTTIFTTQSNRPTIGTSDNSGVTTTIEVPAWADGEYLTMDRDQIGSTVAGANLSVFVVAK